jgi:hypothetical protein
MCRVSVLLASPALADSGFWGGLRPKDFVEGVTERIEILETQRGESGLNSAKPKVPRTLCGNSAQST